jgi:hypothetical protein
MSLACACARNAVKFVPDPEGSYSRSCRAVLSVFVIATFPSLTCNRSVGAAVPMPTFPVAVMRTRSVLFVRMTSGWLFVVPRNSVPVMLLPVSAHAVAAVNAAGLSHDRFPLASVCRIPVATVFVVVKSAGRVYVVFAESDVGACSAT